MRDRSRSAECGTTFHLAVSVSTVLHSDRTSWTRGRADADGQLDGRTRTRRRTGARGRDAGRAHEEATPDGRRWTGESGQAETPAHRREPGDAQVLGDFERVTVTNCRQDKRTPRKRAPRKRTGGEDERTRPEEDKPRRTSGRGGGPGEADAWRGSRRPEVVPGRNHVEKAWGYAATKDSAIKPVTGVKPSDV
jgi:hypothetical protein